LNLVNSKYVVVSTVRNEINLIDHSLKSVLNQSLPPILYVIVDDSSTNGTSTKLDDFVKNNKRTILIKLGIERYHVSGYNQVIAFNIGVNYATKNIDWDYLLKVDSDTVLPRNYVKSLFSKMEEDHRIGICAGQPIGENIRLSRVTDAARLIRHECWDEIKGYDTIVAFDSHAVIKAKSLGWKTRTFKNIKFVELRSSKKYTLKRWFYTGLERKKSYFPLYHTILASLKNIKSGSPPILNALVVILTHIVYQPKTHNPHLKKEWVKNIAIQEVREGFKEILGGLK